MDITLRRGDARWVERKSRNKISGKTVLKTPRNASVSEFVLLTRKAEYFQTIFNLDFFVFVFLYFFFWPRLWHMEAPRPGITPEPQR